MVITILLTFSLILAACGDEKGTSSEPVQTAPGTNNEQDDNKPEEDSNPGDENGSQDSLGAEDQLDLGIGDTGAFDTTLGTYEMTLNSAKLLGAEFDGEETLLDELILLDITIKNVSDNEMKIEELMESMGVSSDLDGSNSYDGAEDFDSIEKFEGVLAPGEEKTGQFITDVYTAEEYYFKKDSGNITGGSSNQVIWTIKADEAQ
jgi:hypothetical protein